MTPRYFLYVSELPQVPGIFFAAAYMSIFGISIAKPISQKIRLNWQFAFWHIYAAICFYKWRPAISSLENFLRLKQFFHPAFMVIMVAKYLPFVLPCGYQAESVGEVHAHNRPLIYATIPNYFLRLSIIPKDIIPRLEVGMPLPSFCC